MSNKTRDFVITNDRNIRLCNTVILIICSSLFATSVYAQPGTSADASKSVNIPQAEIRNEFIRAKLYLPDTQQGYYMATRFDWSGIIESLEYNGHSYFGQWFDNYSPTIHDAIMGPVEEFAPLGYNEAKPGETFVKIGVGSLLKTPDKILPEQPTGKAGKGGYDRFNLYEVADYGKWTVKSSPDQVIFTQKLDHEYYAYEYTKTVSLVKGKPELEIAHTLKNLGSRTIKTNVYNHNLFVIDKQPTGTGFVVTFPFVIIPEPQKKASETAEISGNKIIFKRDLVAGEIVKMGAITGYTNKPEDFNIRIENIKTGAGVIITGDKPLSSLVFWASLKTLAPEPFIDIEIEPGKEFSWKYNYDFYTIEVRK